MSENTSQSQEMTLEENEKMVQNPPMTKKKDHPERLPTVGIVLCSILGVLFVELSIRTFVSGEALVEQIRMDLPITIYATICSAMITGVGHRKYSQTTKPEDLLRERPAAISLWSRGFLAICLGVFVGLCFELLRVFLLTYDRFPFPAGW